MIIYGPPGVGKRHSTPCSEVKEDALHSILEDAPCVVDATTLRWDPRGITNPLIGSVHDPITRCKKDGGRRIRTKLVTEAHAGAFLLMRLAKWICTCRATT